MFSTPGEHYSFKCSYTTTDLITVVRRQIENKKHSNWISKSSITFQCLTYVDLWVPVMGM